MDFIKNILAAPNDSREKTLFVAIALCLVASIFVSTAAVALRPLQESNKVLDMRRNILEIGGLMQPGKSVDELFAAIETRVVDLQTGEYSDAVDPESYDPRKAAKDPAMSMALSADVDIASIKRQARYALVYLAKDADGQVKNIILPVHGYGLWSTLYGFVSLAPDTRTVTGFGFYDHAETPGLGGEVDNPGWKALWQGKQIFDDQGQIAITVVKGNVDPKSPSAAYQVDGLAGATLTSRGVQNLLHFWMGEQGYAAYLQNFRIQEG